MISVSSHQLIFLDCLLCVRPAPGLGVPFLSKGLQYASWQVTKGTGYFEGGFWLFSFAVVVGTEKACSTMMSWASQVVLVAKSLPANVGDMRPSRSIPGLERLPREGHGNPLQYSCLEIPRTEKPGGLQSIGL